MEVFVQGIHPAALITIFLILVGSFGTLIFYGIWLCNIVAGEVILVEVVASISARYDVSVPNYLIKNTFSCSPRSSSFSVTDRKKTFFKYAYVWKISLLEEVSMRDRECFDESDWELLGTNSNVEDHSCVRQSSISSGTNASGEEIRNASSTAGQQLDSNLENNIVSYIKERFLRFHWVSQWVQGHKKMSQSPLTPEKLKDIEESSIDSLINRLDSLVLSFHSSESSTRTGIDSLSSSEDDFVFPPVISCQKDHHSVIVDSKSECCDYFYPVSASELRDWNQSR